MASGAFGQGAKVLTTSRVDNAGRVTGWLRQKRGQYYCQHCISRETGVTPIAQVNQIVRPLAQAPKEWRYEDAPCSGCGRERRCIANVG